MPRRPIQYVEVRFMLSQELCRSSQSAWFLDDGLLPFLGRGGGVLSLRSLVTFAANEKLSRRRLFCEHRPYVREETSSGGKV